MSNEKYRAGWEKVFGKEIIDYRTSTPEFVGRIPVRQEIEILSADEPRKLKLGWTVSEVIGISVINLKGIKHGTIRPSFKELLGKMTTDEEVRQFIVNESKDNPEGMTALFDAIQNYFPQYRKFLKLFSFA